MSFGKDKKSTSQSSTGSYSGTDNTTQNYTGTTQNTTPTWISTAAPQLFGQAAGLAGVNPQTYVAGPSTLQTTAAGNASGLAPSPYFDTAAAGIQATASKPAPQSTAALASGYVNGYMSPYLKDVLDSSLAAFDNAGQQTQAQQQLQMAGNGAFGGSGAAIDQALTNAQLALGRGTLASGIQNQGYTTALGAAENDANNVTNVGISNANLSNDRLNRNAQLEAQLAALGTQVNNAQNQNVQTQAGLGSTLQGIQQQQAAAPLDLQSWLGQYFSGLPLSLFSGQTQAGTQTGTESQAGTQSSQGTGNSTGYNFGFKLGGQ